jgi:DNA-binding IclR family transcriptional regulator
MTAGQHPAQDAVWAVLASADRPLTVRALAHQAGVSAPTVRTVLMLLDAEGRLDSDMSGWPLAYTLRPPNPADLAGT